MQEIPVQSLGQEDSLEKEIATHSSTLAWKIPWVEEHGGLHTVHWVAKSQTRLSDFTSLPREKYVSVVSAARNPLLPPLLTTF